jgi:hypothetical protein
VQEVTSSISMSQGVNTTRLPLAEVSREMEAARARRSRSA